MKMTLKSVAAAAALGLVSSVALAAPPADPTIGSTATPNSTDNGSLILVVWDSVTQRSIVKDIGLTINQIQPADMSLAGDVINFGSVDLTQLNSGTNISQSANVRWAVVAGDNQLSGSLQRGASFYATGTGFGSLTNTVGNRGSVLTSANRVGNFYTNVFNSSFECANANPCVTAADGDNRYVNVAGYAQDGQWAFAAGIQTAGSVGSSLAFWKLAVDSSNVLAAPTQYAGTFTLAANGALTYNVPGAPEVPLPAAAWLLLSGLGGLGAVSRRRRSV